jgi:RNAse (barnase) inhibitor barstar
MKTDLFELAESGQGGVFRCHAPLSDAPLEQVPSGKLRVVPVKLAAVRDKNAFLAALAAALQFPDYFGRNWDAFYDCLLELNHDGNDGTLLLLRDASGFARNDPEEFAAAVDTLADAAEYWRDRKKALLVAVELEMPALAPELPEVSCRAA